VALLPNTYTIVTAASSQWSAVFTVTNDDGSLTDLTGKTFEMVIRDRLGNVGQVLASVSNGASTANGTIQVDLQRSTVRVILNPVAVDTVTSGGAPYTLWMDPNLSDATALVTGIIYVNPVANP